MEWQLLLLIRFYSVSLLSSLQSALCAHTHTHTLCSVCVCVCLRFVFVLSVVYLGFLSTFFVSTNESGQLYCASFNESIIPRMVCNETGRQIKYANNI